jgi:hypothetical protein
MILMLILVNLVHLKNPYLDSVVFTLIFILSFFEDERFLRYFSRSESSHAVLVGIEPNPGPKSNSVAKQLKALVIKKGKKKNKKGVSSIPRVMGSGDYRTSGSAIGSMLGGLVDTGSSLISSILGHGDYSVNANTLLTDSVPQFSAGKRSVTIRHREFVQDVSGSIAFSLNSFVVNPSNEVLFPWLHSVARNYEQYHFKGLIFEFKSTSADALNSTNTALGTVVLATQYNTNDLPFTGKIAMEQYEFAQSTRPSCSIIHPVECAISDSVLSNLYVTNPGAQVPGDARFNNLGTFNLATVGMQASAVIGELWCSYEIEFLKPRLTPGAFGAVITLNNSGSFTVFGLAHPFGQGPFGTGPTVSPYSTIPLTINQASGNSNNPVVFPPGFPGIFQLTCWVLSASPVAPGTSTQVVVTGGLTRGNVSDIANGDQFTALILNAPGGGVGSSIPQQQVTVILVSDGTGGTITLDFTASGGANATISELYFSITTRPGSLA